MALQTYTIQMHTQTHKHIYIHLTHAQSKKAKSLYCQDGYTNPVQQWGASVPNRCQQQCWQIHLGEYPTGGAIPCAEVIMWVPDHGQ